MLALVRVAGNGVERLVIGSAATVVGQRELRADVGASVRCSGHVRGGTAFLNVVALAVDDGVAVVHGDGGVEKALAKGATVVLQEGDALVFAHGVRYRVERQAIAPAAAAAAPAAESAAAPSAAKRARIIPPPPAPRAPPAAAAAAPPLIEPDPLTFYQTCVLGRDNSAALDMRPLFCAPTLERVLMASYELEPGALAGAFPALQRVPVLAVWPGARSGVRVPPTWTAVEPTRPGHYGTVHGKLFLLFHSDHVRVIVTSANLIASDLLHKANGMWTQRFPLAASPVAGPPQLGYAAGRNDFGAVLLDYVQRLGVRGRWAADVARFDYSGAAVALVSSVPGTHKGAAMAHYGYRRVASVLAAEGVRGGAPALTVQCSSLGKLTAGYIGALCEALCDGGALHVVWPSCEFVRTCAHGWSAGGAIPFKAANYTAAAQTALRFHYEGIGARVAVAPHLKTVFRPVHTGSRELCWLYMGSANLSKSAWGETQLRGTQLAVASFELGVLFVPALLSRVAGRPVALAVAEHARAGAMPLPYAWPARRSFDPAAALRANAALADVPWAWDRDHGDVRDVHGRTWRGIDVEQYK